MNEYMGLGTKISSRPETYFEINEVYRQGEVLCFHHGSHSDKDESHGYLHNQYIRSVFEFHKQHKSYLLVVK